MNILTLREITKSYRKGNAFRNTGTDRILTSVSLDLKAGEFVGLVGRSGCGKSTLVKIALGLERPDSGDVFFEGTKISSNKIPPKLRKAIQVVFQNGKNSCNPRWTAEQIIAEPIRNFTGLKKGAIREKVHELLEQVGLTREDGRKYPNHFSGGEIQRVCIARALAASPKLILLDESVSSLDMVVQAQILQLLEDLRQQTAMTFLLVTHDLRLVKKHCDRALVLDQGLLTPFSVDLQPPLPKPLQELVDALLPSTLTTEREIIQ